MARVDYVVDIKAIGEGLSHKLPKKMVIKNMITIYKCQSF